MKQRVHVHSDCPFFGGCENMLVNFFSDEEMKRTYDLSFSYRSTPAYEEGFTRRYPARDIACYPLDLCDIWDWSARFSGVLRKAVAAFLQVVPVKYVCILLNTVRLYALLRKLRVSVLHINNGGYPGAYSCMAAAFAGRLARVPSIVYVVNNIAFPYTGIGRWYDYIPDRLVARWVSCFVTGSRFAADALTRVLSLPVTKIRPIHNGVARRPVTETPEQVRQRLNVSPDALLMVHVAVLDARKGHRVFLEALCRARQRHPSLTLPTLIIEGAGPEEAALKESIVKNHLRLNVRIVRESAGIFNLMNAADAIILPSIAHEDFPNVVLEAMSLGKPVIASRIAGTVEQVEHMRTGLLVEPGDISAWADAIEYSVENRAQIADMGRAAAAVYESRFTPRRAVEQYMRLYEELDKGASR